MSASILFFRVWIGDAYRGVDPILSPVTQDGAWYHATVKEAMEGGNPWHAALFEGKSDAYPVPDLAEKILAVPGRHLRDGSAKLAFVLAIRFDRIFCVRDFFRDGTLGRFARFSGCRILRISFFAPFLYPLLHPISTLLSGYPGFPFMIYDRPVHPQFEAPVRVAVSVFRNDRDYGAKEKTKRDFGWTYFRIAGAYVFLGVDFLRFRVGRARIDRSSVAFESRFFACRGRDRHRISHSRS